MSEWSDRPSRESLTPAEWTKLPLMQGVQVESVDGSIGTCHVQRYAAGEILLRAGQHNSMLYVVVYGKLSVHLESPDDEPVAFLSKGQTVGELSVIDHSPASAFVRVVEDSRLLQIDEQAFWRLVAASHEFAVNLLHLLADRFRASNRRIGEHARMCQHFENEANVDPLTGLRNRRWMDQMFPRVFRRCREAQTPLALLLIDVDHFKRFNDTYGHAAGDDVLASVGRTITLGIRPNDLAVRYGGEEFVVALPETEIAHAILVADRLREAVAALRVDSAECLQLPSVTISIGLAALSDGDQVETTLRRADQALYQAKRLGRNRVVRAPTEVAG